MWLVESHQYAIALVLQMVYLFQCSEVTVQNAAYNGYRHDTHVNNVLAFSPTGMVMYAAINYPGSWPDSTVSAGLIELVIATIGLSFYATFLGYFFSKVSLF